MTLDLINDGEAVNHAKLMKDAGASAGLIGKCLDGLKWLWKRMKEQIGEPGEATVRVMHTTPVASAATWIPGVIGGASPTGEPYARYISNDANQNDLGIPLDLPNGVTLTAVSVIIEGASGHGALPDEMPRIQVWKKALSGTVSTIGSAEIDGSGSVVAFEDPHSIEKSGLSEVIDNSSYQYGVTLSSEWDTNAVAGACYYATAVTYTPHA